MKPCPKPVRKPKRKAKREPTLEERLEAAIRELVWWRDGPTCIEKAIDGGRCGGVVQWGHFIPRSKSGWLKYAYYNTFCQCRDHNGLHRQEDQTMGIALANLLGADWMLWMNSERDYGRGRKVYRCDLEDRLQIVEMLLETRPVSYTHEDLVRLGYYGDPRSGSYDPQSGSGRSNR